MKADILFINPGNQKKVYQDLSREFTAIAPPAWISLLANFTRQKGHKTAIYDVNVEGWDDKTPGDLISKYNPELIVIMVYGHHPSASTQTMSAAGKIAKSIKIYNRDIPLAMGGTHPSALPEKTLREESVDYIIKGEGPYTIDGLISFIRGKCHVKDVKGLWFKDNGSINCTPLAPIIKNLDTELNGYAWDLLPNLNNYRAHNMHCFQDFKKSQKEDFSDVRTPYVTMNTSLGCPYSCHYCCINATFDKPGIRYWSLDKVLTWIDTLVNQYNIRNIRFDDELFILSPKRVEKFCDLVIERKYDLNIWVYGRIDTIEKPMLKKLKKAGINWICLGIESGNERIRNTVNKNIKTDIKEVVKMIQANDIYVLGNYMFGLPEDNLNTMEDTFQLAVDLNCEFVNFYTVMAYPGSRLYEWASHKEGHLPKAWAEFSQHGYETIPLPSHYLSSKEILKFRDDSFYKYYSNPKYLDMIEKRFHAAVKKHIEKMLEIKVERKILSEPSTNTSQ